MPTKILRSIKGNVVRLTRIDACGVPFVDSCSTVVSECFISITLAGEYESGDEFVQKSAWDALCIDEKDPDILKRVNVSIAFAEVNPDALYIITGSNPVLQGVSAIGSTWGTNPNREAFALEVWTKATGAACSPTSPRWGYFIVPFIRNGKLDGDLTIENGALTISVVAEAFPALDNGTATSTWDEGPYLPNPFITSFPDGEIFGMTITQVSPPTVVDLSVCRLLPESVFWIDAEESETV